MSIWRKFIVACLLALGSLGALAQQLLTPVAVTASNQALPATLATDNNPETYWNSGRVPEQWIELDFQKAWQPTSISVTVGQTVPGYTAHKVLGRTERGEWISLLEGGISLSDRQVLSFPLPTDKLPVRYVRIVTTQSPSVVGWREIKIFGTEVPRPRSKGDVLARDLAVPGLGAIGHLGFWDGTQVYEVLNEPEAVRQNSIEDFIARSRNWAPIYTNIPAFTVRSCFLRTCDFWDPPRGGGAHDRVTVDSRDAMAKRAQQISMLGASYTTFAFPTSAAPQM